MKPELDSIADLSSITSMTRLRVEDVATSDTYSGIAAQAKAYNARMLNTDQFSSTSSFDMSKFQEQAGGAADFPADTSDFRMSSIAARNLEFSATSSYDVASQKGGMLPASEQSMTSFSISEMKNLKMAMQPEVDITSFRTSEVFGSDMETTLVSDFSPSEIQYGGAKRKSKKVSKDDSDSDSSETSSSSSASEFKGGYTSTESSYDKKKSTNAFITGSRRLAGQSPSINDEPAYLLSESDVSSFNSEWERTSAESSEYSTLLRA